MSAPARAFAHRHLVVDHATWWERAAPTWPEALWQLLVVLALLPAGLLLDVLLIVAAVLILAWAGVL